MYVPANSPHAVHHEEVITAMSMNYVDASNLWWGAVGLLCSPFVFHVDILLKSCKLKSIWCLVMSPHTSIASGLCSACPQPCDTLSSQSCLESGAIV